MILAAAAIGSSSTMAAKKGNKPTAPQTTLTAAGQKLEDQYAELLKSLKAELTAALPTVNASAKSAFMKAREDEVAAQAALEAAQKGMGAINAAQGGVGHAKGKWIGGADKGIAAAKANLKKAKTDAERDAATADLAKWEKNREEGVAALKERQAVLDKAERERPAVEKKMKEAEQALADAKVATQKAVKDLGLESLLASDKLDAKLAKYVVLMEATPGGLAAFAQQGEEQRKLIEQVVVLGRPAGADARRGRCRGWQLRPGDEDLQRHPESERQGGGRPAPASGAGGEPGARGADRAAQRRWRIPMPRPSWIR